MRAAAVIQAKVAGLWLRVVAEGRQEVFGEGADSDHFERCFVVM